MWENEYRSTAHRLALAGLAFAGVLGLWSIVTYGGLIAPYFLSTPTQVFTATLRLFWEGFAWDVTVSLARVSLGFALSAVAAIPGGILIATSPVLADFFSPLISFIRYLPVPALVPLCILWFGIGEIEKIAVVFIGVFFQLVLLVADSIKRVPREMVDIALTLGARPRDTLRLVVIPYSAPQIFDTLRVTIAWAWGWIILAEIVGASAGIGFMIVRSQRFLLNANVIAGLLVLGGLGIATDLAFRGVARILFSWKAA